MENIFNIPPSVLSDFVDNVKAFEGLHLEPYQCPSGLWTIGYGHLCSKSIKPIDSSRANDLLLSDLYVAISFIVNRYNTSCFGGQVVELSPEQVLSLSDLVFNIGIPAFLRSRNLGTALRFYLSSPSDESSSRVCYCISCFCRANVNGKTRVLDGLVRRRSYDVELWRKGHEKCF